MRMSQPDSNVSLLLNAIESTELAFSLVEISAEDNPILFVNKAFEHLTGYSQKETLGRDCRFLQNDDKDQHGRSVIRDALTRGEACHTVLRNYRKDGTKFLNELRLSPIRDEDGVVTHFFGCQTELDMPYLMNLRDDSLFRVGDLTVREREMFSYLVKGESTKGAARFLGISPRTAEKHRQSLMRKMVVTNTVELVNLAMRAGEGHSIYP